MTSAHLGPTELGIWLGIAEGAYARRDEAGARAVVERLNSLPPVVEPRAQARLRALQEALGVAPQTRLAHADRPGTRRPAASEGGLRSHAHSLIALHEWTARTDNVLHAPFEQTVTLEEQLLGMMSRRTAKVAVSRSEAEGATSPLVLLDPPQWASWRMANAWLPSEVREDVLSVLSSWSEDTRSAAVEAMRHQLGLAQWRCIVPVPVGRMIRRLLEPGEAVVVVGLLRQVLHRLSVCAECDDIAFVWGGTRISCLRRAMRGEISAAGLLVSEVVADILALQQASVLVCETTPSQPQFFFGSPTVEPEAELLSHVLSATAWWALLCAGERDRVKEFLAEGGGETAQCVFVKEDFDDGGSAC